MIKMLLPSKKILQSNFILEVSLECSQNSFQIELGQILLEFPQIVPVGVEEIPDLIELGQILPENTQTAMVGIAGEKGMLWRGFLLRCSVQEVTSVNLPSSELAQSVPVGSSCLLEPSGLVDASKGSEFAPNLAVPKAQLLVNGLTEAQVWFLGWLREGTRSHELLAVIDCFEVQTRRKNEVAPPPVYPMELSKLKVTLEAGIWDDNRETRISVVVVARVPTVPPTAPNEAGCITSPDVPVGRGKFFLFPPVLEDASMFASLAKRSFGSKTTPRREVIQLYRITRRELEHKILTACSVYFGDKDWG